MDIYAQPLPSGEVEGFVHTDDDPGAGFVKVTGGWPMAPRQNAEVRPFIAAGVVRWDYPLALADRIASAITATYADIEAIVNEAVSTRQREYDRTAAQAQAFKDGGYAGTVPALVACYAAKKSISGQAAADTILARAATYDQATDDMRITRMARQKDMEAATTHAALDAAVAEWRAFIADTRTTLLLPTT